MALTRAFMPVGVVVRKTPGVTRWARWAWRVVAVLPGAGPANWRELRRDGDAVEYHAATLPLELWSSDTEAYLVGLSAKVPSLTVVLRESQTGADLPGDLSGDRAGDLAGDAPWDVVRVTASPYEGQDYLDSGDGLIETVPMPLGMIAWVRDFIAAHHVEEVFVKRRRDRMRVDMVEDGKGDARVRQIADVYRAPRPKGNV